MTIKQITLCIICIVVTSVSGYAQQKDVRLRNSYSISLKVNKKIEGSYTIEHRWKNNVSAFDVLYQQLDFSYKLHKKIQLSADFRFGSRTNAPLYFRESLSIEYAEKFRKKNQLSFRLRLLNYHRQYPIEEYGIRESSRYLRTQLQYQYKLNKRIELQVATEPQLLLSSSIHLVQLRHQIGSKIKLNKNIDLMIGYLNQYKTENNLGDMNNVMEIGMSYSLSRKEKTHTN